MAQGMRQRMALRVPNMWGNESGKQGAACTAGKLICPILESKLKPKMAFRVLTVTSLHMQQNCCSASVVQLYCYSIDSGWHQKKGYLCISTMFL